MQQKFPIARNGWSKDDCELGQKAL